MKIGVAFCIEAIAPLIQTDYDEDGNKIDMDDSDYIEIDEVLGILGYNLYDSQEAIEEERAELAKRYHVETDTITLLYLDAEKLN